MWLVDEDPAQAGAAVPSIVVSSADLTAYRSAVTDLVGEIAARARSGGARLVERVRAERILTGRLSEPEFTPILTATPHGALGAVKRLMSEVRNYQPSIRSSAADLPAQIRIALLAQIDACGGVACPRTRRTAMCWAATELLDLDALRRGGMLRFRYRRQASTLLSRAARSAERGPRRAARPRTAGLRFACARAQLVVLLNQIAAEFAGLAPPGTPPLWVTSLARSVDPSAPSARPRVRGAPAQRALRRATPPTSRWTGSASSAPHRHCRRCCSSGSTRARSTSSTRARPGTSASARRAGAPCAGSPTQQKGG